MEHLRKTGMYIVKPDEQSGFSSDDVMWKTIDQLIVDYSRVHPKEVNEILTENRAIRETMKNEYGSGKGLRWGFRLPPALVRLIERRFKNFFVDRTNIHKFMDRYPAYKVCDIT